MTQQDKIDSIRKNIISNVQVYKNVLAGRYYLYVFEEQYFEMYFGTDNFLHLTGVGTKLSPNQFYELAKKGQLQSKQLFFNRRFPLPTALKKTRNLGELAKFVSEGYFIIRDLATPTEQYPYAITNIDQSILVGLKAEEIEEMYIPKSLRIKGNIFNKTESKNIFEVQAILSKTDKQGLYNNVLYEEKNAIQNLNPKIKEKIDGEIFSKK